MKDKQIKKLLNGIIDVINKNCKDSYETAEAMAHISDWILYEKIKGMMEIIKKRDVEGTVLNDEELQEMVNGDTFEKYDNAA